MCLLDSDSSNSRSANNKKGYNLLICSLLLPSLVINNPYCPKRRVNSITRIFAKAFESSADA